MTDSLRATGSLRALKLLVIGMGVAIVIGVAVVIVTIVQRAGAGWGDVQTARPAVETAVSDAAPRPGFGTRTLDAPRGGRIVDMIAEGDRLFVRLETPEGARRIVVLDTVTGARLGAFEVRESP